jgi:hypothetical protein
MPNISEILAAAAEKVKALPEMAGEVAAGMKPAIPGALERAAAPNAMIEKAVAAGSEVGQRSPTVPFIGQPGLQSATRATFHPYKTLEDQVRTWSEGAKGFFRSDPGLPADLQRSMIDMRHGEGHASYLAAAALRDAHAPVMGDLPKVTATQDYRITADNVAQALRDKRSSIRVLDDRGKLIDTPVDKWIAQKQQMEASPMLKDPAVAQTIQNMAGLWKDVHADMVNEGAIIPERYLSEYTPMREMHSVASGLARVIGDDHLVDKLTQTQRRAGGGGARETNLADVEHRVLTKYFEWKALKKTFNSIMSDPSLDRSAQFDPADVPPHGWEWYSPGPGMPGYVPKAPEQEMLDAGMRSLYEKVTSGTANAFDRLQLTNLRTANTNFFQNGRLIPAPLAKAFRQMRISGVSDESSVWTKVGRSVMRFIIPYNPKSRIANVIGDIPVAMMGLPGEAAHPLGIMKWYPTGFVAGMRDAFNGGSTHVNIGGHVVDVSDLIHEHNIAGNTMMSQMASGTKIHPELTGLVDPSQLPQMGPGRFLQSFAQGLELGPRIAAGLDALQRTGNPQEFGRVAQRSTLEYGAGAPAWARDPHLRVMSPVLQFAGLLMGRMVDLLQAKGSRARTIAALIGIPAGIAAWNFHDDDYKKIANSIPEFARDQSLFIVPNPMTGKPWIDVTGKPVISRLQWNVPDQMLSLVGLGNLTTRVGRVASGRDTPLQFAQESGGSVAKNFADYLTVPGLLRDVLSENDRYGRPQDMGDRIMKVAPILRAPAEAIKAGKDYGLGVAAARFAEEGTGQSFVKPTMHGQAVLDAGMMERRQAVKDATGKARTSRAPSDKKKWLKRRQDAVAELQRYMKALKADTGTTPEAPPEE